MYNYDPFAETPLYMNPDFTYSVTALGIFLSIASMVFIFLGKSIPGSDGGAIVVGPFQVRTNSVIILLIVSLLTASLPLYLDYLTKVRGPDETPSHPRPTDSTASAKVIPISDSVRSTALSVCESLKGNYELYQGYVFIDEKGIKATTRKATWKPNICEQRIDGSYVLEGVDTTTHDIEIIVNNKFEHVATTTTEYASDVLIDKNGQLLNRTVHYQTDKPNPKLDTQDLKRRGLANEESLIGSQLLEYVKLRDDRHRINKTKACLPALSNTNGFIVLAFVCHDYTRVMKKHSR